MNEKLKLFEQIKNIEEEINELTDELDYVYDDYDARNAIEHDIYTKQEYMDRLIEKYNKLK